MEEKTFTFKLNEELLKVNIQAIDIAIKQTGLQGAEALVVLYKTLVEQTGQEVQQPEQPEAEEVPAEVVE
tara:strand:- start:1123 stop:1332 length:210 start_codon:yes stop_codon:yes gene_type:complete